MTQFKKYLNEGINHKGIFKACFMAGSSASGKSYVIKQISGGGINPKVVNTDSFTEYHMKFDPEYSWDKYGAKDKLLAKTQLSNYLNSMYHYGLMEQVQILAPCLGEKAYFNH